MLRNMRGKVRSPKRKIVVAAACAAAATLFVSPAPTQLHAATVSLNPSKDNTLFEDDFGSLSNGVGMAFFAGMTNSGTRRRGLLAFDLSYVPTNAQVSGT